MFRIICFLLLVQVAGIAAVPSDTLFVSGVRFLDSVFTANDQKIPEKTDIFFSSMVQDSCTLVKVDTTYKNCTVLPMYHPVIVSSFDTLEYHRFQEIPGRTFDDSLLYLNANDIVEQWVKVYYHKSRGVVKIENLGVDINVDFGQVISTSYYHHNNLILYANNTCVRGNCLAYLRAFSMKHGSLEETIFLVYPDKVIIRRQGSEQ